MAERVVYNYTKQYATVRDLSSGRKHFRAMLGGRVLRKSCGTMAEAWSYRRRVAERAGMEARWR